MAVIVSKQIKVPSVGKRASDYAVGDSVYIPVNGTNTEFLVVHQGNPDTSIYDASCNGTWLLMKDCYESREWHSLNYNDYANSTIHSYLNGTFLNLFDSNIKDQIKQVKIPYRPNSGYNKTCNTGANGLSAKIFLLSVAEVGLGSSTDYEPDNEGAKLSYFTEGSSGNSGRIANLNGSATTWWLRSPYCDSDYGSGGASYVFAYGSYYRDACSDLYSIRPALVINSDTKFDPDTNIIKG